MPVALNWASSTPVKKKSDDKANEDNILRYVLIDTVTRFPQIAAHVSSLALACAPQAHKASKSVVHPNEPLNGSYTKETESAVL